MRRNGRKGQWLVTDDTTGFTEYSGKIRKDYWNNYTAIPLLRNLQEIATPLSDPYPVPFTRGPNYEVTEPCFADTAPLYIGTTTTPTVRTGAAFQALDLDPAIPNMVVGCTFVVH